MLRSCWEILHASSYFNSFISTRNLNWCKNCGSNTMMLWSVVHSKGHKYYGGLNFMPGPAVLLWQLPHSFWSCKSLSSSPKTPKQSVPLPQWAARHAVSGILGDWQQHDWQPETLLGRLCLDWTAAVNYYHRHLLIRNAISWRVLPHNDFSFSKVFGALSWQILLLKVMTDTNKYLSQIQIKHQKPAERQVVIWSMGHTHYVYLYLDSILSVEESPGWCRKIFSLLFTGVKPE